MTGSSIPYDPMDALEALDRINAAIVRAETIDQMLDYVLREMLDIFQCDRAWVFYPILRSATTVRCPMEHSRPEWPGIGTGTERPVDDNLRRMIDRVLSVDGPICDDTGAMPADSPVRAAFRDDNIATQMTVALYPKEDEPWSLGLQHCGAPRHYNEHAIMLFRAVGNRLSDGLSTFRAMERLSESEAMFRSLVDRAPDAIVVVDIETGAYVDANESAAKLHGITVSEMIGPYGPVDLSPNHQPDGRRSADVAAAHLLAALQGEFPKFEWTHMTPGGELVPCEIVLARLPHPTKKLIRGNVTDIRPRITAERERAELEARLAQAQKMEAIGQLTGGIAHDFNNILTVILGNLELLADFSDPIDEMKQQVAEARTAAMRARDLTHRLLAFARRQPLQPQSVNVGDLLRGMHPMLKRTLGEGVTVTSQVEPDLWNCEVDTSELEQALLNLAINARDAIGERGEVKLSVSNSGLSTEEPDLGDCVLVEVTDNGVGIDADILPHIFTPFFTTKEVGKGTGLGLSMVYGFVSQSGGHIDVRSVAGEGSTVSIYLPRTLSPALPGTQSSARPTTSGRGEQVLVAEDQSPGRRLTVAMLCGLGY